MKFVASTFILIAVLLSFQRAIALDVDDVGVYAVVNAQTGKVTDKVFRVIQKDGKWTIEDRMPDGSWKDVTCTTGCYLTPSSAPDVEKFFGPENLKSYHATCVHNMAFAFCRLVPKGDESLIGYALVALTTARPTPIHLERLSRE